MTLRAPYALGHSEFNEFLFASVGHEKTGIELTVLSAFARLDFDPWAEAARLAELPKETATRALAATIALLPEGDWKASDARAIAQRLVRRLPGRNWTSVVTPTPPAAPADGARQTKARAALWLVCILLSALVFLAMTHRNAAPPAAPASHAVSASPRPGT
jgi:hypothetical protein